MLGVVILGAGASLRMGRPKLLLPWNGSTVIGHIISQWRDLGAMQIAVVMRPDDNLLKTELDRLHLPETNRIGNPEPEQGMFSSILCSARWEGWRPEISHWAIVLGDQPHLQTEPLARLLEFSALHPESICQPAVEGHSAHPVILPRPDFATLKTTTAATLKEFLKQVAASGVHQYCEIDDSGFAADMDTPEDYERLIVNH